jgi:hypothetical protein
MLYLDGHGVPRDLAQAYMWFIPTGSESNPNLSIARVDESDDSAGHGGGSRCETAPRFGINKVAQRSDLGERKEPELWKYCVDEMHTEGGDDHFSFLKRGVAASDLVDYISYPYWCTPQDAIDKIDRAGMQAARQRLLEVLPALEERRE